ncbi:hypothetical protein ERC79_22830 [Rhodococcus sp. ABRD24]|nr:hypothetical protein ERC79_22830 [Rhodococcus sp. ABRD24]
MLPPEVQSTVPADVVSLLQAVAYPTTGARPDLPGSVLEIIARAWDDVPRSTYLPRSVHLTEGLAQSFLYETIAKGCIPFTAGPADSVGVASAIAGPAVDTSLPESNLPAGTVNFLFSAINTGKSLPTHGDRLKVAWFNTSTLESGVVPLVQERPADWVTTLSATVRTGRGTVVAAVFGSVLNQPSSGPVHECGFAPVVGVVQA